MKKIIATIIFLFSITAFSQTKQDTLNAIKKDSIMRVLAKTVPIIEFQEWLYENIPAKKYAEDFAGWWNTFLDYKYSQTKQVPNKTKPK